MLFENSRQAPRGGPSVWEPPRVPGRPAPNTRLSLLGDPLHNFIDVDARTIGQSIEFVHMGHIIHVWMSLRPQSRAGRPLPSASQEGKTSIVLAL